MRGNIRRHAHRDAVRAVHQKIGEAGGEHGRLRLVAVEVRDEIHRFLVEVFEHFRGELCQPRLRITHRRGGVAVDAAEVAVTVHQREIDGKVLRKAHQRVVHRAVAVRMVFTERVADDTGALAVRFVVV